MNSARELSIGYLRSHPEGAVSVLESLAPEDASAFLKEVPDDIAARAFEVMQPLAAAAIVPTLTRKKAAALLLAINTPSRSRILRLLDGDLTKSIKDKMPTRAARDLDRFLRYPERSAGAWMSSDMAVFERSVTVHDCLAQLRALPDTLRGAVFVVDAERKLFGAVDVAKLLAAPEGSRIDVAVRTDIKRLSPFARLVSIVALSAWDTALFCRLLIPKETCWVLCTSIGCAKGWHRNSTRRQSAP